MTPRLRILSIGLALSLIYAVYDYVDRNNNKKPVVTKTKKEKKRARTAGVSLTRGVNLMKQIEARKQRDIYQKVLFDGINPKVYKDNLRKTQQNKITFREAFEKWFALHKGEWGERTAIKQLRAFELHIFPEIGDTLVEDIKPIDMLKVFRKMDDKGISETLKKVRGWSSRVFRDCVVLEIILSDPTRDLPTDSFKKQKSKNYATVTTPDDIKDLLKTLIKYKEMGTYQVAEALNLAPYLLLRPGELTKTEWDEIDFKNKLIRISAERMKMSKDHLSSR